MALECCREPYSWILPCGVLGDTGNSCWKMPCTDLHGMSLVVVVFLGEELILYVELLGVAGLRVETLYSKESCHSCRITVVLVEMWKHHCILYSKID